jgi:thiol-disulfide isomerase/thioredoxin
MQSRIRGLLFILLLTVPWTAWSQDAPPSANLLPDKPAAQQDQNAPGAAPDPQSNGNAEPRENQEKLPESEAELQFTVQQAGNDDAALVRNLEAYLHRHPESAQRLPIYRAIVESEMKLHNQKAALDYAEQIIAVQPEDGQTMYTAAMILETMPDEASQNKGIDYDTKLIDRVSKANPDDRPQQMTLEDWQSGRSNFSMKLYILRASMERNLHKNDEAVKDLTSSFNLVPNAEAALYLGEIAEEEKHSDEAVRQYAVAFFLAGGDPNDNKISRDSLRLRMGNLWRYSHDSNAGLGDVLLSAFDRSSELAKADQPEPVVYNKGITDPLQYTLRRIDGNGAVKTGELHGKIVILNFWTTWCAYCRTMETMLADVRKNFSVRDDVISLAVNSDEQETLVAPFLQEHKIAGTPVFADGLSEAFHVQSIPTVIVLDRSGKIAYRTQGFAPEGFVDAVSSAITKAAATAAQ